MSARIQLVLALCAAFLMGQVLYGLHEANAAPLKFAHVVAAHDTTAPSIGALFADGFDPPPPAGCPQTINLDGVVKTLAKRSGIDYTLFGYARANVDLSEWNNIWGYNNSDPPPPLAWPGVSGSQPIIKTFRRDDYLCAHFRTGNAPFSVPLLNPTAYASPDLTVSVSSVGGDFSRYLPTPGCLKQNVPNADVQIAFIQSGTTNPTKACNVQPNTDYYINIYSIGCTRTNCPISPWRGG